MGCGASKRTSRRELNRDEQRSREETSRRPESGRRSAHHPSSSSKPKQPTRSPPKELEKTAPKPQRSQQRDSPNSGGAASAPGKGPNHQHQHHPHHHHHQHQHPPQQRHHKHKVPSSPSSEKGSVGRGKPASKKHKHTHEPHSPKPTSKRGSGSRGSKTSKMSSKKSKPSNVAAIYNKQRPEGTPQPGAKSGMRFDELYRLKGVLGTGAFSTVREGYHRSNTSTCYAVKCVNRKKLSEEDEAALLDEVAILMEMQHVHIIRLYDFFTEPSTYYLVMEQMRGGELFDRIVAKAYYNEKEARDTCKILLQAVGYMHQNHVAHRDLKPENLLLLSKDDDSAVKIADFGFAKKVYEESSLTTQCGTPGYVAPEILEGTPYDQRADMWSVGVILYILLGGYPPFIESTQRDLFRKIRRGEYEFHEEYWGTVSSEAKDLISSLLTVDPKARLDADEALENAWIMGDDASLEKKGLGVNLTELRKFNAKRKFKAAVSTIMAINKLNALGKEFLTDSGGSGEDKGK